MSKRDMIQKSVVVKCFLVGSFFFKLVFILFKLVHLTLVHRGAVKYKHLSTDINIEASWWNSKDNR